MTSDPLYEADMSIIYDVVTKTVVVSCRGKITLLGPFPNRRAAIVAGESFCRERGWGT